MSRDLNTGLLLYSNCKNKPVCNSFYFKKVNHNIKKLTLNINFDRSSEGHTVYGTLARGNLALKVFILSQPHILNSEVEDAFGGQSVELAPRTCSLHLLICIT